MTDAEYLNNRNLDHICGNFYVIRPKISSKVNKIRRLNCNE